jgi:hypothetical protein
MKPLIPVLVLSLVLTACNNIQSDVTFTPEPIPVEDPLLKLKQRSCEWDPADYELRTHLLAFEMNNNKTSFGFNILNKFFKAFGFKFKVTKGSMIFRMDLFKPQDRETEILNVKGDAEYSKKELGFEIDFGAIQLGMDRQSATPITTLVERGLSNTLNNVSSQLSVLPLDWKTHVSLVDEDRVRIPIGVLAGVRKGDQFSIFNVVAKWDGEPCKSHYGGEYKSPAAAIAVGTVTDVDESVAYLELSNVKADVNIGARVEILKLIGEGRTTLKKSIRLVGVSSQPITLDNGSKIDLLPFVSEVIKPVLTQGSYYIRN